MKIDTVVVHEGSDWIVVSESGNRSLNEKQYQDLLNYFQQTFGHFEMLLMKPNHFMFVNYVGFIKLETVYLEILPKISLAGNPEADRARLIEMLVKSGELPVKLSYNLQDTWQGKKLWDIIAAFYIAELSTQLNRGIFKEYVTVQENRHALKGKLLLSENARTNRYRKDMAFCSFDEYTENNPLNQILKLALRVLDRDHQDNERTITIHKLFGYYSEVEDIAFHNSLFSAVNLNRQNQRYDRSLQMAKIILLRLYSKNKSGKAENFSMLFEMNVLYEKYIACLATKIAHQHSIKISVQDKEKYLLHSRSNNRDIINLKPDIVLEMGGKTLILDTKWKSIIKNQQLNYSIGDIYQMYAYITRYEKASTCILLYPWTGSTAYPEWNLFTPYDEKIIRIADMRLDTERNTSECLHDLMSDFFK